MTRQAPRIGKGEDLSDTDVCRLYLYLLRGASIGKARTEYDEAVRECREQRKPRCVKGVDGKDKVVGWRPPGGSGKEFDVERKQERVEHANVKPYQMDAVAITAGFPRDRSSGGRLECARIMGFGGYDDQSRIVGALPRPSWGHLKVCAPNNANSDKERTSDHATILRRLLAVLRGDRSCIEASSSRQASPLCFNPTVKTR